MVYLINIIWFIVGLSRKAPHQIINNSSNDLTYLVIANNTPFELGYYPDSDKVWFAGTLAKGQKEGLTKVQSGFTNDYWKDEE